MRLIAFLGLEKQAAQFSAPHVCMCMCVCVCLIAEKCVCVLAA